MRRPSALRLAASLIALGAGACNCGTGPLQNTVGVLALPNTVLQFKNVCPGQTLTLPLTIANEGRAPLTIKNITISATAFAFSPAPQFPLVIAPDGSVALNVVFTPPSSATAGESFVGILTVTSNAAMNPSAVATLEGTIFDGDPAYPKKFDVTCLCNRTTSNVVCGLASGAADAGVMPDDPCDLLTYIAVPDETSLSRTVTLVNQGCEALTINAEVYDNADGGMVINDSNTALFTVGAPSPITLQGGQSQQVTLTFNPTGDQQLSPDVRVRFTSDATNPVQQGLPVGVDDIGLIASSVAPQLVVSPSTMAFFNTPMGMTGTQTFTVSNAGNNSLDVTSITITPSGTGFTLPGGSAGFTLGPTGSSTDTRTETVAWTPTSATTQQATVSINTAGATATIALYGGIDAEMTVQWVNSSGALQPPPINFGQTATGATGLSITVQISNNGNADLSISGASTANITNTGPSTSFSIEGFAPTPMDPVVLSPGQNTQFKIVFNDDVRIQNNEGTLNITSDDAVDQADNGGVRVVDILSTNAPDFPPIANICNPPETATHCMPLELDGTCTMAAAGQTGDTITYQWAITNKPPSSTADLVTPTDSKTAVSSMMSGCNGPDLPGSYTFSLVASDQYPGNSSPAATATVTVQ